MLQLEFKGEGVLGKNRHDGQQLSLNPYVPSGLFHPYQWAETISKLRCLVYILHLYSISNRTPCKQTV